MNFAFVEIMEQWNKDGKIQEEYKQIASHIYSELQKLKIWEAEMAAYKAHEVTQEEQEGEGNAMRPVNYRLPKNVPKTFFYVSNYSNLRLSKQDQLHSCKVCKFLE